MEYTYTTLRSAILAFADDPGSEFSGRVDDFISKGETRCVRDLDLENSEQWVNLTISESSRSVPKPTDAIHVNSVFIRDPVDLVWAELPRRSFEYLIVYAPTEATESAPVYFAEEDEENLYLAPTPDQDYVSGNAKCRATIRPEGLSSSNEESFLGNHYGDLLFNAAMIEAKEFQKSEAGARWYAAKYESLLPSTSKEIEDARRKRYKNLNTGKQGADD
jgi:hypothetical protein